MKKQVLSLLLIAAMTGSSVTAYAADSTIEANEMIATIEEESDSAELQEEYLIGNDTEDVAEEISEDEAEEAASEENTEEISEFDETLNQLYEESATITDEEIFEVAAELPSEYALLQGREDAEELVALIEEFEAEKVDFILGNSELNYTGSVAEELLRQKYYSEFNIGSSNTLVSLVPKVQIQDVYGDEVCLSVDLYEWVTEGYQTEGSDIVNASAYGFNFTLEMNMVEEEWQIVGITGTESNYADLEGEGVFFEAYGIDTVETVGDETLVYDGSYAEAVSEEETLVGASYSFSYSASAAVAYADKWAMSYNPSYPNFIADGVDCANFVSQSLYAGGLPLTDQWNIRGSNNTAYVNWVNNSALHDYLVNNGFGTHLDNPTASKLKTGDLVFYKWNKNNTRTNHVTIVVGKNAGGVPVIDSHTSARYHAVWNYGASGTVYTAVQMKSNNTVETANAGGLYKSVYRMYNPANGEHLYTLSTKERDYLVKYNWVYEGIAWYAPVSSSTPIYRVYDRSTGKHHYTTSKTERNYLVKKNGWTDEGIFAYSAGKSGTAVYRQYNKKAKNAVSAHNFTKDSNEKKVLVKSGWTDEGIAWYGLKVS